MLHNEYVSIQNDWRELDTVISDSRELWNDATRKDFYGQYWGDMVQIVNVYLSCLYELAETIDYVKQNMP